MLSENSISGSAVVIGAGVMGAGIAALLANIGWEVTLLDRALESADPTVRNSIATAGIKRALQTRPPHFALPGFAERVKLGNVEDDLDAVGSADWVVEAAAEDLEVKRALLTKIARAVAGSTVISTNTSGLGIAAMSAHCPVEFRARFLGSHFFNPPRYMRPVEIVATADTNPTVFAGFGRFADYVLGKQVIVARDTPGFISTRLGMFALVRTLQLAEEYSLSPEMADYLTGPLIGRPRSGTFRLADVIGLDVTARIIQNLRVALPGDSSYASLAMARSAENLIAAGCLGEKSGSGFYKRSGREILVTDQAGGYRTRQEPDPIYADISKLPLAARLQAVWKLSPERDAGFLRAVLVDCIGYMASATPEVADRIVEVDDAITGGFGWELGPFHTLDALTGVEWPEPQPAILVQVRREGAARTFYANTQGAHSYYSYQSDRMLPLERPMDVLFLKDLKKSGRLVAEAEGSSLVDLGDGVLCMEWHTPLNVLNPAVVAAIESALARVERDACALVLGGWGDNFCAGFDLKWFMEQIDKANWNSIDGALKQFQDVLSAVRRSTRPVVAAVYGYALGGGCEVALHCSAVQAAFDLNIGLPEVNVGLIPAGGGVTRMLQRAQKVATDSGTEDGPFAAAHTTWSLVRKARVALSAPEALKLGYLRAGDLASRKRERHLYEAKALALRLAADYRPVMAAPIPVLGAGGLARLRMELHQEVRAGTITEFDRELSDEVAWVVCGGDITAPASVSEEYLLALERRAFTRLVRTAPSRERIAHMLSTGKPLRN